MEEQNQEAPRAAKRRAEGALIALAAFCTFAGATAMALYYRYHQETKNSSATNLSGFDIAQTQTSGATPAANIPAPQYQQEPDDGGISMIRGGLNQSAPGLSASSPAQQAAMSLTAACRAHESEVRALAMAYTRKYPVIAQYGRDWMSYPDLRRLNDDYMKNHNPIAFIHGVAASKNFRILVRQYAAQPEIQAFVKDVVAHAPADVLSAVGSYLNNNQNMTALANSMLGALGLPPGLISMGGSGTPQINTGAMLQSILSAPQNQPPTGGTPTLSPP